MCGADHVCVQSGHGRISSMHTWFGSKNIGVEFSVFCYGSLLSLVHFRLTFLFFGWKSSVHCSFLSIVLTVQFAFAGDGETKKEKKK